MSEVPREFVGLARAFYWRVQAVNREIERVMDRIERVINPRIARGKHTLRPEHVAAIERLWRTMPDAFRLGPPCFDHPKKGLRIEEIRLQGLKRILDHWTDKTSHEPAIAITVVTASVTKKDGWVYAWEEPVTLGLHALARRYERGGRDRSDAAILADLAALIRVAAEQEGDLAEIPVPSGRWRGRVGTALVYDTGGNLTDRYGSLSVQTFLEPK
jgi:hypothetical protein